VEATRHLIEAAAPRGGEGTIRMQTIVRLRWLAVLGQLLAVSIVWLLLGFPLPIGSCLMIIALSAWINVFLAIRYPARHRMEASSATALLAYDMLQLSALLYLTGGIVNPFTMLMLVPVTVSAATLPIRNTLVLGVLAALAAVVLVYEYHPLPWYPGLRLEIPLFYKIGILTAIVASMMFLAIYAYRLAKESRQMSAALAATELVLAREQKLHALDGLAAAAAHELGTPLATIVVVAKELERGCPRESPISDDIALLQSQATRCREILQKLTRHPSEHDPLHASLSVRELLAEAARPYMTYSVGLAIRAAPAEGLAPESAAEPVGERRPGVIYGIGNIIENATEFASSRVEVTAEWNERTVEVTIADDGPGFKPEVMDSIGEPYVTTRPADAHGGDTKAKGLGLGFFIAKTLLERSGAGVNLENRPPPATGAVVRIRWPRSEFEAKIGRWPPPPVSPATATASPPAAGE
jgi:two-component system sensor histidine kinase RegB